MLTINPAGVTLSGAKDLIPCVLPSKQKSERTAHVSDVVISLITYRAASKRSRDFLVPHPFADSDLGIL
jgi:hypothetical protein